MKRRVGLGDILFWLVSIVASFLLLGIFILYLSIFLLHSSPTHQQLLKGLILEKTDLNLNLDTLRVNWDEGRLWIEIDGVSYQRAQVSMEIKEARLLFTPFSYLSGGSLAVLNLDGGGLVLDTPSARMPVNNLQLPAMDIHFANIFISLGPGLEARVSAGKLRQKGQDLFVTWRGNFTDGSHIGTDIHFIAELAKNRPWLLYADLRNLVLSPGWQNTATQLGFPQNILQSLNTVESMQGNIQLWGNITQDRALAVVLDASLAEAKLQVAEPVLLENMHILGRFQNRPQDSGWLLYCEEVSFLYASEPFLLSHAYLSKRETIYKVYVPLLDGGAVASLASSFIADDSTRGQIIGRKITGLLQDIHIQLNTAANPMTPVFQLNAYLDGMTISPYLLTPGASGISGQISIMDTKGWFSLDAQECSLFLTTVYDHSFHFDHAQGIFAWEWLPEKELLFVGEAGDIYDDRQVAALELALHIVPRQHVYMDLVIGAENATLMQARGYMPNRLMPDNVEDWIGRALQQGRIVKGALAIHGDTKYFSNPTAQFELLIEAQDVVFKHTKNISPLVTKEVDFIMGKQNIYVTLPAGGSMAALMNMTRAAMRLNMISTDLSIQGSGSIPVMTIPRLVETYTDIGMDFANEWRMGGELNGNWEIAYGIKKKELNDLFFHTEIKKGFLQTPFMPNSLREGQGVIGFSSKEGYSGEVTARLGGELVKAHFVNTQNENYLEMNGNASYADYAPFSLGRYMAGESPFRMKLKTARPGEMKFSEFEVNSSLYGTQLNLPFPLNKTATEILPFFYRLNFDAADRQHRVAMDGIGRLAWRMEENVLKGAIMNLSSSPDRAYIPASLTIQSDLKNLNMTAWQEVINAIQEPKAKSLYPAKIFSSLVSMQKSLPQWDVMIKNIQWQGHSYEDLSLGYNDKEGAEVFFASKQLEGSFLFDEESNTAQLNFSRFALVRNTQQARSREGFRLPDSISWTNMPDIFVTIPQLSYDDELLGDINLIVRFKDDEMKILIEEGHLLDIPLAGFFWWGMPTASGSVMELNITAIGTLTRSLGPLIHSDGFKFLFSLSWAGLNEEFTEWKKQAEGRVLLDMSDGSMASQQTNILANLFKLLNINTLTRRLGADFSDLSADRVDFETLRADMNLDEGILKIENEAEADFSFIEISITGYYDLLDRQLAYEVVAASPITKILPLTALLLGASALTPFLLSLETAGGDFLTRFSSAVYSVEGSLTQPEISLVRIGDIRGREVSPDELSKQINVQQPLRNLQF